MIHFSKTKTFYPCVSVSIRGPKKQTSKADRTPKKTSDLVTDGHGYTRMRIAGFLALHREKIGTKLYGYVLAKRYTRMVRWPLESQALTMCVKFVSAQSRSSERVGSPQTNGGPRSHGGGLDGRYRTYRPPTS